jgi:16S rRNA (cytosine1402-N4)-methyltransferase
LNEVVDAMSSLRDGVIVDCTLGCGGHTEALLRDTTCRVVGVDRDDEALAISRVRLAPFGDRFTAVKGSFGDLSAILQELEMPKVDGVLADLGVSSVQLDRAERGFSFRFSGPVDMRRDQSATQRASDIVNTWSAEALADAIRTYGEERHSRRIASAIVRGRPWHDTRALAAVIADAMPRGRPPRIHPATRTFQALRIVVNDELGEIERLLPAAVDALSPQGRLAIISFHSLEDRIVKRFIALQSGRGLPRDPYGNPVGEIRLQRSGRSIVPSPDETNPRARSARLRVAVRL